MNHADRRTFLKTAAGAIGAVAITPDFSLANAAPSLRPGAAKLPVGVVGLGKQGRAILGELQKLDACEIVAVCDNDPTRLTAGQRRVPGAEGFATLAELLDKKKDVQAIIIATPTHTHREHVQACLTAGKHVYCEAPLAATIEDCKAIVAAARAAEGKALFQTGLLARSNPVYTLARSFYRSDAVRTLVTMRAQNNQKSTWRAPASDPARDKILNWHLDPATSLGMAGELGTHQFDVFHFFTGKYPTSVRGYGSIRVYDDGRKIPDTIACDLFFDDGIVLQYQATLCCSLEQRYEVLYGSNASIKLGWSHGWMFKEADAPTLGWEVYANRQQFHNDQGITLIADATKLAAQGKLKEGIGLPFPAIYYGLADFLKSILESKPVACSAEEGLRATVVGMMANRAVMSAFAKGAAEGELVKIDPEMLKA